MNQIKLYKYTGKEKDITGLYYYGVRYYDPAIGRFTTKDPARGDTMNPQSLNPYVYCMNNPLKYIDPDGQFAHDHDWVLDSLYLTWQDMWDASHSDDRNDHWDPDKSPSKREHRRSEIWDFPINSVGIEATGSWAKVIGGGGGIGFVIDENLHMKLYIIQQKGGGYSKGVDASVFFSSSSAEEIANSEAEGFENSCGPFYFQSSSSKPGIDKFNMGGSVGVPFSAVYWEEITTSPITWEEVKSWLKEQIL